MFGYVVVNKPEMKIKDFDRYREYYCGVCHSLGERHKISGKMCLTYDSAFMALLLTALYEPKTKRMESGCIVHPIGKKKYLNNCVMDYVADMNLLLSYYKCVDDWDDDKNFVKLGYSKLITKQVRSIQIRYLEKTDYIEDKLKELYSLEEKHIKDVDGLSNLFGDIMGELMAVSLMDITHNNKGQNSKDVFGENWKDELRNLGFYLGKYIYIIDAFDDLDEDYKKKEFNPFMDEYKKALEYGEEAMTEFENYIKDLLMMAASRMAAAYERLPIVNETGILRNIIYSGIWTKYFSICKRRHKE